MIWHQRGKKIYIDIYLETCQGTLALKLCHTLENFSYEPENRVAYKKYIL